MSDRKKILHIIMRTSYDGAAILPARIIKSLKDFDHNVVSCYKGSLVSEINDIKCFHLNESSEIKKKSILKIIRFIFFLTNNKFDIIHYHCGGLSLLILAAIFNKNSKVIHHMHTANLTGSIVRQKIPYYFKYPLKLIDNRTIKIAASEGAKKFYYENIKRGTAIEVLKNYSPFNFKKKEDKNFTVGYIGRITKEKGINKIIGLIENPNFVKLNLKLIIKGDIDNEAFPQIKHYIDDEKILYEKSSLDIKYFYNKIDLLLFLSTAPETSSLVVLEALSCDVGVIAYKNSSTRELLGEYPLLISKNKDEEILEKIVQFYEDKFILKLSNLNHDISKKYDQNIFLTKIKRIYTT